MFDSGIPPREESLRAVGAMRELLESGYRAELVPSRPKGDHLVMGYYSYDSAITSGIAAAGDLLGLDRKYLTHIAGIRDRAPESLSTSELSTMFTFLMRGERFSDGMIAGEIESGRLLALTHRLEQLVASGQLPAANES